MSKTANKSLQRKYTEAKVYHGKIDGIHGALTVRAVHYYGIYKNLPELLAQVEEDVARENIRGRELMLRCAQVLEVSDLASLCYLEASILLETNQTYNAVEEAYWTSDSWRRANIRYYPYHGRGHIQLTWRANYVFATKAFKLQYSLVDRPAQLLKNSALSMMIAVAGCKFGWFTGRNMADYFKETKLDFINARKIVNGITSGKRVAKKIAGVAIKLMNTQLLTLDIKED